MYFHTDLCVTLVGKSKAAEMLGSQKSESESVQRQIDIPLQISQHKNINLGRLQFVLCGLDQAVRFNQFHS